MPWARIPCDKLAFINQFGYKLEHEDGRYLWYRDNEGKLHCVDRYAPRFWFDSVGEASQAGAVAVRISSEREAEEMILINQQMRQSRDNDEAIEDGKG